MENNITKKQNAFVSEEEKTLDWSEIQVAFKKTFGEPRLRKKEIDQFHKDIASSVQRRTEEIIFEILERAYSKTGLKNVCIAGGVAQNSVANGKILQKTSFKDLYIPSAGHDAGISIPNSNFENHILKFT